MNRNEGEKELKALSNMKVQVVDILKDLINERLDLFQASELIQKMLDVLFHRPQPPKQEPQGGKLLDEKEVRDLIMEEMVKATKEDGNGFVVDFSAEVVAKAICAHFAQPSEVLWPKKKVYTTADRKHHPSFSFKEGYNEAVEACKAAFEKSHRANSDGHGGGDGRK